MQEDKAQKKTSLQSETSSDDLLIDCVLLISVLPIPRQTAGLSALYIQYCVIFPRDGHHGGCRVTSLGVQR
jgi:hypothetical protein